MGQHQGVKLSLTGTNGQALTALTPNTALPFIVIVANPNGTIAESTAGNNIASFETHTLGVVVHGLELDALLLFHNTPPDWEMQMTAALQQHDGYEAVLPFNWVRLSVLPFQEAINLASNQLVQQVTASPINWQASIPAMWWTSTSSATAGEP